MSTPERKITSTTSTSSQPQQQQRTTSTSPVFLVQSFTKGHHNPQLQRSVLSFTTVPSELTNMMHMIKRIVTDVQYNIFDAIHINVPWTALRFQKEHFPTSLQILDLFPNDPRIIINRLMDHGPTTRYFGALGYEQHPDIHV